MISYVLTPNPVLQLTDNSGCYVANGSVETLDWNTRQPKPTYFDPGGVKPRPNPFPLDSIGRAFTVYWEDDAAYFLVLRDRDGNIVWTSAEPYTPGSGGGSNVTTNIELENLFLNGQMRFFDALSYSPIPDGLTEDVADGGWSFLKDGANPDDSFTFVPFNIDNTDVDATPIYYVNYVATTPGVGETEKDFQFNIKDVRSLSNEQVTVAVEALSVLGGTVEVEILATQFFGTSSTGGPTPSATVTQTLGTISLTTAWARYPVTATINNLTGKTVGNNGDDFLQIKFRFPRNTNANIQLTNFYLKRGAAANLYPYETYAETLASLNRLNFPDPNKFTYFPGSTYPTFQEEQAYDALMLEPQLDGTLDEKWLPPIPIGSTQMFPSDEIPPGWIQAAGQELLKAGLYNRLYFVPFTAPSKVFGNAYGTVPNNIIGGTDVGGVVEAFQTVTTATGTTGTYSVGTTPFTLLENVVGHTFNNIGVAVTTSPTFRATNTNNGVAANPGNTTSMVINVITNGSPTTPAVWEYTAIPGSSITGGQYISYETQPGNLVFYVWFKVNGVGTDPAIPGATGYEINIDSTYSADEVGNLIGRGINGLANYTFTAVAASLLNNGEYFLISTTTTSYAVYYRIDGILDPPTVPGATLVPVEILSTDTSAEVATKTAEALNPLLWKMPDWRGSFMRAWDDGRGLDPDSATRTNRGDGTVGDNVGTFQDSENLSHAHDNTTGLDFATISLAGAGPAPNLTSGNNFLVRQTGATNLSGGLESRPKNYYFNLIVKY